jgi:hypothetical protein
VTERKKALILFALVIALCALGLCVPLFGPILDPWFSARIPVQGKPLVRAIYAFKEKRGTWPSDLRDLCPEFLAEVPPGWRYDRPRREDPPNIMKHSPFRTYLIYFFPPRHDPRFPPGTTAGWIRYENGSEEYVPDP